jgi:hypothetical protein
METATSYASELFESRAGLRKHTELTGHFFDLEGRKTESDPPRIPAIIVPNYKIRVRRPDMRLRADS